MIKIIKNSKKSILTTPSNCSLCQLTNCKECKWISRYTGDNSSRCSYYHPFPRQLHNTFNGEEFEVGGENVLEEEVGGESAPRTEELGGSRVALKQSSEDEARTASRNTLCSDNTGLCSATTTVELIGTAESSGLGLLVKGGVDKDCAPYISAIKPGSISQRSDAVCVGDRIVSVGGVKTDGLRHAQIMSLLKKYRHGVNLEIEYDLPEMEDTANIITKTSEVTLRRDGGSLFGLTLRGGIQTKSSLTRPLTVIQIRPESSADINGLVKVGDRVTWMNEVDVRGRSLSDALKLIRRAGDELTIRFEYNVSVIDAVENATGQLLVEIDKPSGCPLGIEFASTTCYGRPIVCIDTIRPASIADRCGALHVGDQVLSIDDVIIENATADEATRLLQCNTGDQIQIKILPRQQLLSNRTPSLASLSDEESSITSISNVRRYESVASEMSKATVGSMTTQVGSAAAGVLHGVGVRGGIPQPGWCPSQRCSLRRNRSNMSCSMTLSHTHAQVCHTDTTTIILRASNAEFGFGIEGSDYSSDGFSEPPFISYIEPGGAAERTGLLQEGDRLLAVNGQPIGESPLSDVFDMILTSKEKLSLTIEFDVAESIVPSSGMFLVKLAKRGAGIGISISCPKNRKKNEPLVISDVRKGSVAHRTGTISPGDWLIAINDVWLDTCSLDDAADILTAADNIIKLRIQKNECFANEPDPTSVLTYQVELPRFSGPLGISLSGSEQPFDPIYIASLSPDGVAYKTGALRVGDRILSVNGTSLRGRSLYDALRCLRSGSSSRSLTIKIMRSLKPAVPVGSGDPPTDSKTASQPVAHDASQTASQTASHAASQDALHDASHGASHGASQVEGQDSAKTASHNAGDNASHATEVEGSGRCISDENKSSEIKNRTDHVVSLDGVLDSWDGSEIGDPHHVHHVPHDTYLKALGGSMDVFCDLDLDHHHHHHHHHAHHHHFDESVRPDSHVSVDSGQYAVNRRFESRDSSPDKQFSGDLAHWGLPSQQHNTGVNSNPAPATHSSNSEDRKELQESNEMKSESAEKSRRNERGVSVAPQSNSYNTESDLNQQTLRRKVKAEGTDLLRRSLSKERIVQKSVAPVIKHYNNGSDSERHNQACANYSSDRQACANYSSDPQSCLSSGTSDASAPTTSAGYTGITVSSDDNKNPSVTTADIAAVDIDQQLREVDEQLKKIFTSTPLEMIRTSLDRESVEESFGFSLSDGVYEKGIYVGAVKHGGPAHDKLKPYDRIIKVNEVSVAELSCEGVVPLIARSGVHIDLVICRNPLIHRFSLNPANSVSPNVSRKPANQRPRNKQSMSRSRQRVSHDDRSKESGLAGSVKSSSECSGGKDNKLLEREGGNGNISNNENNIEENNERRLRTFKTFTSEENKNGNSSSDSNQHHHNCPHHHHQPHHHQHHHHQQHHHQGDDECLIRQSGENDKNSNIKLDHQVTSHASSSHINR